MGTSTTQLILSQIQGENQASGFTVPEMVITHREILYRSPVHFTPLKGHNLVDGEKLQKLVLQEYEAAGITRKQVDTGAMIITGETSRKENAREVLQALSGFAGDFVVATAGPDLESVLAAKGAGATEYSGKTGKTVLHMDIGGGTSNLALIRDGEIIRTGCLNVGGRLLKLDEEGKLTYISPVLKPLCDFELGDRPSIENLSQVAEILCNALEMASGRKPVADLLRLLSTDEVQEGWIPPEDAVTVSFSGGVADCIANTFAPLQFGDIGPLLGQAIRNSSLCRQAYILGQETIRATVIGAGCHSTQLSGSTVFCQNMTLPIQNRPVVTIDKENLTPDKIRQALAGQDTLSVLALPELDMPNYADVKALAATIAQTMPSPILVVMEQDMAKALGQAIALCRPAGDSILCIDRVRLKNGDYLDVGNPIGPALPVVVKTLILEG